MFSSRNNSAEDKALLFSSHWWDHSSSCSVFITGLWFAATGSSKGIPAAATNIADKNGLCIFWWSLV